MKKVLVVDNYDSFTFNLVHYLEDLDCNVTVIRNDEFDIDEIKNFDAILLSPGPGIPNEAGLLKQVIEAYGATKCILGICLGQQAIGEVFGASLINLEKVYHGIATPIDIIVDDEKLFFGLKKQIEVGRYHSWVINPDNFPEILEVTSTDNYGQIMSLRHRIFNIRAMQFHPESILTTDGKQILKNWIEFY